MRSASDNGIDSMSLLKIWATNSITGSGSMKAVDDMSKQMRNKKPTVSTEKILVEVKEKASYQC